MIDKEEQRTLYEKIMTDVAKAVKRHLNENKSKDDVTLKEIMDFLDSHPGIDSPSKLSRTTGGTILYKAMNPHNNWQEIVFGKTHNRKYDEDTIWDYLDEHPEIKQKSDLPGSIYAAARHYHMLDDLFDKGRPNKKITKQEVRKYIQNHKSIKSRFDLYKHSEPMYNAALKYGMLDKLFGGKTHGDASSSQ